MFNPDALDALTLVAFLIGIANYNENLTQNDKDDIMKRLDQQTKDILVKVQNALEEQNYMLEQILEKLNEVY